MVRNLVDRESASVMILCKSRSLRLRSARPLREIPKGENLWLIREFLVVVQRERKENSLISYGFFEKPLG